MYDKKRVDMLREQYPIGTRIELVSMDDPYSRLKPGDKGKVMFVDDIGTIHVNWDCGSTLGLVDGEDSFKKTEEQQQDMDGPALSM